MAVLYDECSGIEGYHPHGSPMYIRFERISCLPFPWSKSTFHHMVTAYNVALRTGMLRHCCSPFHDDLPRSIGPSSRSTQDRTVRCSEVASYAHDPSATVRLSDLREVVMVPSSNKGGVV